MPATKFPNAARAKLEAGKLSIGVSIKLARTVEIAKMMKTSGFDWLFIDLEHSTMSLDTAAQISVAALDVGITPIPRVPFGQYSMATRLLDNGALGIVIPHVDTADQAREIVDQLRYPPIGNRSISSKMAQFDFKSVKPAELMGTLNDTNIIVAMIETVEAVENIEAIAAVPGIDGLMIGANDLTVSLGIAADYGNEKLQDAARKMVAACKRNGKWPGIAGLAGDEHWALYVSLGAQFLQCGADFGFLMAAGTRQTSYLNGLPAAL